MLVYIFTYISLDLKGAQTINNLKNKQDEKFN